MKITDCFYNGRQRNTQLIFYSKIHERNENKIACLGRGEVAEGGEESINFWSNIIEGKGTSKSTLAEINSHINAANHHMNFYHSYFHFYEITIRRIQTMH